MNATDAQKIRSICRRCGECCRIRGFVRVSADEVDGIAGLLRISPRAFADRYTRISHDRCGLELEEKENGECVFLDGAECVIHDVKPEQCRTFPDGWRYPGVEEICPACGGKSQFPNPKSPARLSSESVAGPNGAPFPTGSLRDGAVKSQ